MNGKHKYLIRFQLFMIYVFLQYFMPMNPICWSIHIGSLEFYRPRMVVSRDNTDTANLVGWMIREFNFLTELWETRGASVIANEYETVQQNWQQQNFVNNNNNNNIWSSPHTHAACDNNSIGIVHYLCSISLLYLNLSLDNFFIFFFFFHFLTSILKSHRNTDPIFFYFINIVVCY